MENWKMDLHTHSNASDGTYSPAEVVRMAYDSGIRMLALSDHDTVMGIPEAREEAIKYSDLFLIPAVEMDTDFPEQLHIQGMGIDPENKELQDCLTLCEERRNQRNEQMVKALVDAGYDIRPYFDSNWNIVTRAHIALGLVQGGFAKDKHDVFKNFIGEGCPYYVKADKFTPKEAIEIITRAGGYPVMAHPCLMKGNIPKLVDELVGYGLKGIEAYYSKATEGQTLEHLGLARQYGLFVTCGSDYHGAIKPEVELGCAWQDKPELYDTYQMLKEKKYN